MELHKDRDDEKFDFCGDDISGFVVCCEPIILKAFPCMEARFGCSSPHACYNSVESN